MMNQFKDPKNTKDLICFLKGITANTFILAGGTDLSLKIRQDRLTNYNLIDLSQLEDNKGIFKDKEHLVIGSNSTISQIGEDPLVKKYCFSLHQACQTLGSTQIRNAGTLGGNICNASQSSDTLPCLFAYGATGTILNSHGDMGKIKIERLVEGSGKNRLAQDEVLMKVMIPLSNDYSSFIKIGDKQSVTIAKLNSCLRLTIHPSGIIENAVCFMGAIGSKATRTPFIENYLIGKDISDIPYEGLKQSIQCQIDTLIPNRSSRVYKRKASFGLIIDALSSIKSMWRKSR